MISGSDYQEKLGLAQGFLHLAEMQGADVSSDTYRLAELIANCATLQHQAGGGSHLSIGKQASIFSYCATQDGLNRIWLDNFLPLPVVAPTNNWEAANGQSPYMFLRDRIWFQAVFIPNQDPGNIRNNTTLIGQPAAFTRDTETKLKDLIELVNYNSITLDSVTPGYPNEIEVSDEAKVRLASDNQVTKLEYYPNTVMPWWYSFQSENWQINIEYNAILGYQCKLAQSQQIARQLNQGAELYPCIYPHDGFTLERIYVNNLTHKSHNKNRWAYQ